MITVSAKPHEVKRAWVVMDASGQVLGRLATEIARRLCGKHKAEYTPHVDTGDYVVVVNAEKVHVTGKKRKDKIYYRHSGYTGGIYQQTFTELITTFPGRIIEKAVKGMLPKGPLGREMFRKLRVYKGAAHPHVAQEPVQLSLNSRTRKEEVVS